MKVRILACTIIILFTHDIAQGAEYRRKNIDYMPFLANFQYTDTDRYHYERGEVIVFSGRRVKVYNYNIGKDRNFKLAKEPFEDLLLDSPIIRNPEKIEGDGWQISTKFVTLSEGEFNYKKALIECDRRKYLFFVIVGTLIFIRLLFLIIKSLLNKLKFS